MNLRELIDTLKEEDFNYIKDNACPLTDIDNYDFGNVKQNKTDYAITDVKGEKGSVKRVDEQGYLQEEMFEVYSEKFIYYDWRIRNNRLDIDNADFNLIDSIDRDHEFSNRITVAYKYLDRVFLAYEKQSTDPFEVKPRGKAIKCFDNEDWEGIERLTL